jgi:hypothetical protein
MIPSGKCGITFNLLRPSDCGHDVIQLKLSKMIETRESGETSTISRHSKGNQTKTSCVYCNTETRRSSECDSILTLLDERKKLLATKKLCSNCTGPSDRASECRSTSTCRHCNKRHHSQKQWWLPENKKTRRWYLFVYFLFHHTYTFIGWETTTAIANYRGPNSYTETIYKVY